MSLPMKSTSLAEVLTPGQTVADCINHCRRSWQEILCIHLPRPTLGLVLSPHCMWHLEQTTPTDIIKSKWSLFPSDWHRFLIASFKRFDSKRCSLIAITRWQITVVFDDGLWSLRLWPYGSLLNGSTVLNFLMNQNSSVSILLRNECYNLKTIHPPLCHVTRVTVGAVEHTNSFIQYYLRKMFRPNGSSLLGYPSSKKTFNFTRDHYTRKSIGRSA